MQMVAGACGVESHDGDFLFKVDGAIQSSHDHGKPGQQRPKSLLHVVLSLHLVHAQLQRVILLGLGKENIILTLLTAVLLWSALIGRMRRT